MEGASRHASSSRQPRRIPSFSYDGVNNDLLSGEGVLLQRNASKRKSAVTFAELPASHMSEMESLLGNDGEHEEEDQTSSPFSRIVSAPRVLGKSSSLPSRSSAEALRSMESSGRPSPFQHVSLSADEDKDTAAQHTSHVHQPQRHPPMKSSTFSARSSPVAKDFTSRQNLTPRQDFSPFSAVGAAYLSEAKHERWAFHGEAKSGSHLQTRRSSSQGGDGILGSQQLQRRRSSQGGSLFKGKSDAGKPLLPTRQSSSTLTRQASTPVTSTPPRGAVSRQGSCRTSGSALSMHWDSLTSTPRRLSCNGSQAAYEEMTSQGYALPSSQGRSRRSWSQKSDGGSGPSVADHIAHQARKSSQSGCVSKRSSFTSVVSQKVLQTAAQPNPPADLGFSSRTPSESGLARVKDAFQALLG